ncbi:uncharacterized protein OCT59_016058 [Rhizophagus irregularis]|uniref:Uncharacterized protein n=3 Tax=Rhizophagus irregularis TaxID=588596 RepID=A0A2N1NC57_9GLOM|nr:hypothetical protein GLOIN_2v1472566 [Rhizophagus irregularis DAOM 181602=DAOM 197198]EXX64176.1 hypothetical protein RirG_145260 [Rhizophagus irregularis DAOM 197198w]PKK71471.1 hypothetical protein RhiirC2_711097 [Rhizophagus irregularis]POG79084.1 hypothetical protein GLOIN_2v1472566 [Rhizophagus irregularis DAOM 181602=DAOM 197198]UZO23727.1 hypothetical protein OCT59_016058 [Rhizophagus irregularis]CAB4380812.1 unnamed protein product [Rhizophagus irregularis]|eukprot:XP_025185950.1 hypothetical protein GLOIN_2v1472566 [Rhizophagus irregularis DAOM 181602=DAOM 197198]
MDINQLNQLKRNSSELQEPLHQRVVSQKGPETIDDWEMIKECFMALNDNTNHLFDMMNKREKVFDAILNLLEEILIDKMSLVDDLSIYRDYIIDLIEEIEAKLGTDTWRKVRNAIRKKRNNNRTDFEEKELEFISELENKLKDVEMTVNEFELLMEINATGNTEFHKGKRRVLKEVKKQLESSLPNNLQVFKVPLRKLLYAHEIWKLSK